MCLKDANSVEPNHCSDLGLHCLPRPVCPKTYDHYSTFHSRFYIQAINISVVLSCLAESGQVKNV